MTESIDPRTRRRLPRERTQQNKHKMQPTRTRHDEFVCLSVCHGVSVCLRGLDSVQHVLCGPIVLCQLLICNVINFSNTDNAQIENKLHQFIVFSFHCEALQPHSIFSHLLSYPFVVHRTRVDAFLAWVSILDAIRLAFDSLAIKLPRLTTKFLCTFL